MHLRTFVLSALVALCPLSIHAQRSMPDMPRATTLIDNVLQHASSGSSVEPASTPMQMLMRRDGSWTLMLHGVAFVADTQQQAADERGADKLFSSNWLMPMAQRRVGSRGELTLRAMLSLEPATITGRYYPELFQQGETADGKPIVDGQHPHDFAMELAALYDFRASEHTLLSFYAAPVGDPAIGPTAYPHRQSASEDPIAALGHHQEDSTHIAFNVLTAGISWRWLRLEASGFHGAEPTEARWHFQPSPNGLAIDSASARLTWAPTKDVAAQYSVAQITSPEALSLGQNQRRQTASVMYNRSFGAHRQMAGMAMAGDAPASGNWASTLLWGQTRNETTGSLEDSYLLESLINFRRRNDVWTRMESAARTNELLELPDSVPEATIGHVQAYSFGYDRDFRFGHLLAAPGAQFTVYRTPDSLVSAYGRDPFGAVAFVRFRLAR
jgi:hypothetical protein